MLDLNIYLIIWKIKDQFLRSKMLEITNLNKFFGKNQVLKNINLKVRKSEIIAILGASGSGKSTLLRCINMLDIPNSGNMILNTRIINLSKILKKDIDFCRKNTAMVFQNYNLFANKNAIDNITLALKVVKKMPDAKIIEIARDLLKKIDLSEKETSYPHQLSGGQQQRIAIARALALNPKIILFDEPTSALDPLLVEEVLQVIAGIKNQSMIIVTHELEFAKKVADKIIFMNEGKIIEKGDKSDFFDNPKTQKAKEFLEYFKK